MTKDELDWVEAQAAKNFEAGVKARADLNREVHVTASFLGVAVAASFAAGLRLWYQDANPFHGALLLGLALYISIVLGYTVLKCLRIRNVWPQANEPKNLIEACSKQSLELVRQGELLGLQERIEKNDTQSWEIGRNLNLVRWLIIVIPALYIGAMLVGTLFI